MEQRRKLIEEKEAAAERRLASLRNENDLVGGFGLMEEGKKGNMLASMLIRIFRWMADATMHTLNYLNLIS